MLIEENKVYNMDCLEFLEKLEKSEIKPNCVLTSPPYNIIRPNSTDRGYDLYKDGITNEQYCNWIVTIFNKFNECLAENSVILWNMSYGTENTECMSLTIAEIIKNTNYTLADIIVWEKHSATPNNVSSNKLTRINEFVYVFCRRNEFYTFQCNKKVVNTRDTGQLIYGNVFNKIKAKNNDESCELNKATFSTELCFKLLELYTVEKDIVLDIFMGTYTTAVACHKSQRKFLGCELSKAQCDYGNKRLSQAQSQFSLFDL